MSDEQRPRRKTRTREHVIADLGVNYVARQVLLAGFTADRVTHDYGIDLLVTTFSPAGEVEVGHLAVQVKATDHPSLHANGQSAAVRVATADWKTWAFEWEPVLLVLYDAAGDRAFWLDVQEYARTQELDEDVGGETLTLRVPVGNVLDVAAVRNWRDRKERRRGRPNRPGTGQSSAG